MNTHDQCQVSKKERGSGMKRIKNDSHMLEEYDFSGGVRGKYAKGYAEGTNVVIINPDVAEFHGRTTKREVSND
jgi:hypothetical protein